MGVEDCSRSTYRSAQHHTGPLLLPVDDHHHVIVARRQRCQRSVQPWPSRVRLARPWNDRKGRSGPHRYLAYCAGASVPCGRSPLRDRSPSARRACCSGCRPCPASPHVIRRCLAARCLPPIVCRASAGWRRSPASNSPHPATTGSGRATPLGRIMMLRNARPSKSSSP